MDRREFSRLMWQGMAACAASQSALGGEPQTVRSPTKPVSTPVAGVDPGALAMRREVANVADFQAWAKNQLPRATYEYITSGSTDEVTLRDNVAAFQRIRLLPPLLTGVDQSDCATTVLGQRIALPILLAPVAAQNLYHRDGGAASARAAAKAKTIFGVSTSIGNSIEEIAAASAGPKWFQLYMPKDRGIARQMVERAERSGYKAIIVTVDLGERKDADLRNHFALPRAAQYKFLRDVGFAVNEQMSDAELQSFNQKVWDFGLSWKVFEWLRTATKLPLLVKGVLRADDARRAISLGVNGVIVSNHGGRRLDGVPATIDQLPQVVDAIAGRAEVLLDSGVRRGTDVLKALAFGAKAVLIGRPYAWALAADGEAGVSKVLTLLQEELISAMHACGCAKVADINRSVLLPRS